MMLRSLFRSSNIVFKNSINFKLHNTTILFKARQHNLASGNSAYFADKLVSGIAQNAQGIVGKWLLGMSGMCFGAIVLGGVTRLTESGLSMVDWNPFKESLPSGQSQWESEFEKYKQFPQYQHIVRQRGEMSLEEFKFIWMMEYSHRMWGRAIGYMFIVPAFVFLSKGFISAKMKPRLYMIGSLLIFQGGLGWYMVRSGLENPKKLATAEGQSVESIPRVSHYRLCAHLSSAVALYSLFLWSGMCHLAKHPLVPRFNGLLPMKILTHSTKGMMFTTLVFGALVAGLDAGLVYNSWPKMANRWVPEDLFLERFGSPLRNLVDNPVAVQFTHRLLAYTTVVLATATWITVMAAGRARTGPRIRRAAHLMMACALGQAGLGIATVLSFVQTHTAATHQAGSIILLSSLLWLSHALRAVPK